MAQVPSIPSIVAVLTAVAVVVLGGGYLMLSVRTRRLGNQRQALLRDVGLLQQALLPPVPEQLGAVRTSVAYRPSDGPGAGGDFYDALTLPGDRAAFILGDISGHGHKALARTAFMRFTLRAYLEAGLEPREALQLAGPVVAQHLDGDFATAVIAIHDPAESSLTYACAGHPAPIVVGPERLEPVLVASSPPVGLDLRTGLRQTTLPLRPGAVICLYTDGLAEARKATRILGRPRLGDFVEELRPTGTAADLIERVAAEARLVTDDMAAVIVRPSSVIGAVGVRREQLEVDLEDASSGLAERFLAACQVGPAERAMMAATAGRMAHEHGTAVIDVRLTAPRPQVEVLPGNVVNIKAAAGTAGLAPGAGSAISNS
ncbi:MAG TPA: PP2C family protein-serine/threonine phosphatase [Thermoleophilaceae bacterium]|nr:PP2C family protein-serine/threonine phosphatase [Thermoleophilaceae bacterium]